MERGFTGNGDGITLYFRLFNGQDYRYLHHPDTRQVLLSFMPYAGYKKFNQRAPRISYPFRTGPTLTTPTFFSLHFHLAPNFVRLNVYFVNMKQLLLILCCVCPFVAAAQATTSYGNFKVSSQELIYQKVFLHDSATVENLAEYYGSLPFISDVAMSNGELTFSMNDLVVDYKKFGLSQVSTPPIIQTGKYSGKVNVSVKDGKYRVTVSDIKLTGDIGYKKITSKENLTSYACRDNGTYISGDWTKPNTLGLLDKAFTDNLEYREKPRHDGDDDW